jgi:hypothetical protein
MIRRWGTLLAILLWSGIGRTAAAEERDLGQGLGYVRVRELPADLPAAPPAGIRARVIDLRYVASGRDGAAALAAWLKFRASPRTPVLVVANRDTAAEVRQVLREPHAGTGWLVVGIPGPGFEPDVAVAAEAEQDRRAYEALNAGAPLAGLLQDHPDKVRNDERRLAQAGDRVPAAKAGAARTSSSVVDAALQRAVHLHRALVALRRVPP